MSYWIFENFLIHMNTNITKAIFDWYLKFSNIHTLLATAYEHTQQLSSVLLHSALTKGVVQQIKCLQSASHVLAWHRKQYQFCFLETAGTKFINNRGIKTSPSVVMCQQSSCNTWPSSWSRPLTSCADTKFSKPQEISHAWQYVTARVLFRA